jgi:hypothetical protein
MAAAKPRTIRAPTAARPEFNSAALFHCTHLSARIPSQELACTLRKAANTRVCASYSDFIRVRDVQIKSAGRFENMRRAIATHSCPRRANNYRAALQRSTNLTLLRRSNPRIKRAI